MSIYKFISIISIFAVSFLFPQDVTLSLNGNDLNYESSADIAGFQFNHDGCAINASGGAAELAGFTISKSESNEAETVSKSGISLFSKFSWYWSKDVSIICKFALAFETS